jgi:hypothetical protein
MPFVHIQTVKERRKICQACPKHDSNKKSCLVDNKLVNEKFFTGICPLNKFTSETFYETEVNKKKAPSLSKKIISFSTSMFKWANSGFLKTSKRVIHSRLEICKKCEFWDKKAWNGTGKCNKCGCSTWAKIRLRTEKCPIGKW